MQTIMIKSIFFLAVLITLVVAGGILIGNSCHYSNIGGPFDFDNSGVFTFLGIMLIGLSLTLLAQVLLCAKDCADLCL